MIEQLLQMLLDGRVVRAFNEGYDAVIEVLIEIIDPWLRSVCPAYAIAMEGAELLAPDKLKALRLMAVEKVFHGLGIDEIIKGIIKQWLAAPATVREASLLYADAGHDFKVAWDDPSISHIYDLVSKRLPAIYAWEGRVLSRALSGDLETNSTTNWVLGFADVANDKVAGLLDKWHLGPLASAVRKYGQPILSEAHKYVGIASTAVDDAWKHLASGDIQNILYDATGGRVLIDVASAAYGTAKSAVNTIKEGVKDVASAGSKAASAVTTVATLGLL